MPNIAALFGIPAVKPWKDSKAVPQAFPDPSLLMGVELEIESAFAIPHVAGMKVEEDGSLRNGGREFITSPATYSILYKMLAEFFKGPGFNAENYSERTSIHVHCNCQDLDLGQIGSLLMLYQVFERMLFQFAGGDRDKNIFCVPLYECALSYSAVSRLQKNEYEVVQQWSKYSALNLLPLTKYGTVEFRHMPGTNDFAKITQWLQLLGCLFAAVRKYNFDELKAMFIDLNTTSQYRNVTERIFGLNAGAWNGLPYEPLLEEGVLNMKYSLVNKEKKFYTFQRHDVRQPIIVDDWLEQRPARDVAEIPGLRERINVARQQWPGTVPAPVLTAEQQLEIRRLQEEMRQQQWRARLGGPVEAARNLAVDPEGEQV